MAAPQRLHGHRFRRHHHLFPPQTRTHRYRKTARPACGAALLGAEFRVPGERVCELREDSNQVWEEEGLGAEWMENADCELKGYLSCVGWVGKGVQGRMLLEGRQYSFGFQLLMRCRSSPSSRVRSLLSVFCFCPPMRNSGGNEPYQSIGVTLHCAIHYEGTGLSKMFRESTNTI